MSTFVIQGGKSLRGTIAVAGMKNAATPILAAALLTQETCVIKNVPRILDVARMLEILQSLGAEAAWTGDHEVTITARELNLDNFNPHLVCRLRSSILLVGPLLARLKSFNLPEPGGCHLGSRPLDSHWSALTQLGAKVTRHNGTYEVACDKLVAAHLILPEFSVTATENALMAAALASGTTVIEIAAAEPHVQDLCNFLNALGAKITGIGTHTLTIEGVTALHGANYTIIPDQIEAGTWAVLAAATKSELKITGARADHLSLVLLKLREAGVNYSFTDGTLVVHHAPLRAFKVQAMPYPGFPTDLQAPFGLLATQASGTSMIHDPLFEGRFGYIHELIKMGANAIVADPHRVIITGPTPLYAQEIKSLDLRAGITLIMAALTAEGETRIQDAEVVDRGYEDIVARLQAIGADIRREE